MTEKTIPWWRKALHYAIEGIRTGFGLFSRQARPDATPEPKLSSRFTPQPEEATALIDPLLEPEIGEPEIGEPEIATAPRETEAPAAEAKAAPSSIVAPIPAPASVPEPAEPAPVHPIPEPPAETAAQPAPSAEDAPLLPAEPVTEIEPPPPTPEAEPPNEVAAETGNREQEIGNRASEAGPLNEQAAQPAEAPPVPEVQPGPIAEPVEASEPFLDAGAEHLQEPQPEIQPIPEPVQIAVTEPAVEFVPEPEAKPEPVQIAALQPAAEMEPEPETDATAPAALEPVAQPESAVEAEPESIPQAVNESVAEPAQPVEPSAEAAPEPIPAPAPQPSAQPADSPPAQPDPSQAAAPAPDAPAPPGLAAESTADEKAAEKTAEKAAAKLAARQKRLDESSEQSPFSVLVGQVYDGPLDLLLDLIRKQDIDIYDIPIARITAQFLAYVNQLKAGDVDVAGEFIYTASLLIHIKSKMLLPRAPSGPEDAGDDPRLELVDRLLEHERFKNAAQMLQQKQMLEAATWTNPGLREFKDDAAAEPEIAADTVDLVRIFRDILDRARKRPVLNLNEDSVTVGQMIHFLGRRLIMEDKPVALRRLLSHTRSERALIAMFLALLELVRLQAILLRQDRAFSEIFIKKHTAFDSVMDDASASPHDDWR